MSAGLLTRLPVSVVDDLQQAGILLLLLLLLLLLKLRHICIILYLDSSTCCSWCALSKDMVTQNITLDVPKTSTLD